MKSILKYTSLLLLVGMLSVISCTNMLEPKIFTDMSPDNFFQTEGDLDAAVTGIYLPCTTDWGYSDGGTGGWYASLFNADEKTYYLRSMLCTDELIPYNLSNPVYKFTVGPSTFSGSAVPAYSVIRFVARATDVINRIENCSASTEAVRNRYIAETKTLRALYMYVLYDTWGPLNVKVDPTTLSDNTIMPRPSEEEYIGYMLADLNDATACATLPDKYNNDGTNWGRMSKGIAYMLKLKVNMHIKNWKEAENAAREILKLGYSILPDYEDVFNVRMNNEIIFGIPVNSSSENYWLAEVLPGDFMIGENHQGRTYIRGTGIKDGEYTNGWTFFALPWKFYDKFEDKDKRKATILCRYTSKTGAIMDRNTSKMVGAIPIKYMDTQVKQVGVGKDVPLFRYAEVLLSLAEAINEQSGPTTEAVELVRQITNRAGVDIPATALAGKESFRDFLLDERGRELYDEGVRRQDLIRHGKFISNARERGMNAEAHQVLFPIPQEVITEGGGIIKQNEGYTN